MTVQEQLWAWRNPTQYKPQPVSWIARVPTVYPPAALVPPEYRESGRVSEHLQFRFSPLSIQPWPPAALVPPEYREPGRISEHLQFQLSPLSIQPWPWAGIHPPGWAQGLWPFEVPESFDPRAGRKKRLRRAFG